MMILNLHTKLQRYLCGERRVFFGGVYMTPGRLSPRSEYTPVPSHGSIFVYTRAPGLHDTTTKCYVGVSSPRFLFWGENFTPVRNLAAVSCKRETTTRFGVKHWNG